MTNQDNTEISEVDHAEARRHVRRRRRKKAGLWSLFSVAVLGLASILVVLSYLGTPITLPEWARSRLSDRINAASDGVQIELGDMVILVEEGWKPHISLRNVELRNPDGTPLATLSELGGMVAMRPLLHGQVQPGSIRLSGMQLSLRREKSGAVDVSVGAPGAAEKEAADIGALIAQIDEALQSSALAALTHIEADNLTLRYEDARSGKAWNIDGGRVELTREDEDLRIRGDFALLGARAYATTLEMSYASRIGETSADFAISFEDVPSDELAIQSPALAWLGALKAPISGSVRMSVNEQGGLGPFNAALHIAEGVLQPTPATKPVAFSSARSYFTYDPASKSMRFENLELNSKWVTARAEGAAYLVGLEDGWPRELQAQMRVSDIIADPADLYPEPIKLDAANMDLRLQLDPFRLSLGQLSLSDQGQQLVLSGELSAEDDGWDMSLDGHMDGLDGARLMQLWPESVKENTRNWVAENVQKADLSNMQLAVRSTPKHSPDIFLGFDFENLTTKFMKKMPPINEASGHASLVENRFAIRADSGYVTAAQGGKIDVAGTSFVVPDVTVKRGVALAFLETDSTITAALSLLDEEPFEFLSKVDLPVTLADGQARVSGKVDFLLKPKLLLNEVTYEVAGKLSSVRSEVLVPGRVLAASELSMSANNSGIKVGGDGRLGHVPFSGEWQSKLGPDANGKSRLEGRIELSERFVDEFRIGLPPGSLSGANQAKLVVDLEKGGAGDFSLVSDLSGVSLQLPQLDWSMSQAATGILDVTGRVGTPPRIDKIILDVPGLTTTGSVSLKDDGVLDRALFSRVQVGSWLDAPVELVGRGVDLPPLVRVTGGMVDLSQTNLNSGRDSSEKDGGPITLQLDRLLISDGIELTNFAANLDTSKGADGSFSGRVNGGAAITGRVVPQDGRSAFRILSQDAGGVLGSAGLLKQAKGGDMEIILVPGKEIGHYNGRLEANDVWLTDAPALAALLNSISVVGLIEQLSGNGILFGKVQSEFTLSPDQVTLYSGSAVGASMGISMDGYYFMQNGQMDMQGVVSPIYLVNGIGGVLTRRGEGLIGFNYTLKGSAANPRVKINPLTLFTPGMFRNIFRRAPPGEVSKSEAARNNATDGNRPQNTIREP